MPKRIFATATTTTHMADAVAARTPLPTVLFLEIASTAASSHLELPVFSQIFLIPRVTSFKILGKRSASAPIAARRQTIAVPRFLLKITQITAITAKMMPNTREDLPNLYAVSLLSKMMSLMDVLSALKIAFRGIRHSITTAKIITPAISILERPGS